MDRNSNELLGCMAALRDTRPEYRRAGALALALVGNPADETAVGEALASETDEGVREVLRWAVASIEASKRSSMQRGWQTAAYVCAEAGSAGSGLREFVVKARSTQDRSLPAVRTPIQRG